MLTRGAMAACSRSSACGSPAEVHDESLELRGGQRRPSTGCHANRDTAARNRYSLERAQIRRKLGQPRQHVEVSAAERRQMNDTCVRLVRGVGPCAGPEAEATSGDQPFAGVLTSRHLIDRDGFRLRKIAERLRLA